MLQYLQTQYGVQVHQWDECDEDGQPVFAVWHNGRLIVAASCALLLSALQDATHAPLVLMAA